MTSSEELFEKPVAGVKVVLKDTKIEVVGNKQTLLNSERLDL